MPKKSKRQRKLLKEQELKKATSLQKGGVPYSKHTTRICNHFTVYDEAFSKMSLYGGLPHLLNIWKELNLSDIASCSHLRKASDNKFVCKICGKEFTAEQAAKIDALCEYLKSTSSVSKEKLYELLTDDITPCEFYFTAPNEALICGKLSCEEAIERFFPNKFGRLIFDYD